MISIHALREEGDDPAGKAGRHSDNFYPRPPRGGRPDEVKANNALIEISIHALREEGDTISITGTCLADDFYPRPPRGGRRLRHPAPHVFG